MASCDPRRYNPAAQIHTETAMDKIVSSSETPERKDAPAPNPQQPLASPRSLRIVVADDDKDTVNTLKVILEDQGHTVRPVYSSTAVMAAVRNFEPDAIILDISMPGESGYSLAKQVRTWFNTYQPLLVAINGIYMKPTDALISKPIGFDHHLTKPCNIDELLALLEPRTRTRR
jgi:CheY-like chemotaxis protein